MTNIELPITPLLPAFESIIRQHGWMVQGVGDEPPFAYTIGLHNNGLPELIVFGIDFKLSNRLLNDIARWMLSEPALQDTRLGKQTHEEWQMPFFLLPLTQAQVENHAFGAIKRSQGLASYLQVCLPDSQGLFPWEPGCSEGFKAIQPVLGVLQ